MFNEFRQDLIANQKHIWMAIFTGAFFYGHLFFALLTFTILYVYLDSKNVAFDSPMLDHPDNLIKITPLERGY